MNLRVAKFVTRRSDVYRPGEADRFFLKCERTNRPYIWIHKRSRYSELKMDLIGQSYWLSDSGIVKFTRHVREHFRAQSSHSPQTSADIGGTLTHVRGLRREAARELTEVLFDIANNPEYQQARRVNDKWVDQHPQGYRLNRWALLNGPLIDGKLSDCDLSNLERQLNRKRPPKLGRFFSPAMLEEYKKLRGIAT